MKPYKSDVIISKFLAKHKMAFLETTQRPNVINRLFEADFSSGLKRFHSGALLKKTIFLSIFGNFSHILPNLHELIYALIFHY